MSDKMIKRFESFFNALFTTYMAVLIWYLVEILVLGSPNENQVDMAMAILFFLYVYWRNMKEGNG